MSQVAKFCIELNWKEFNVDLNMVDVWMKANAGEHYCGNQAGAKLELWFLEEPSQESKEAVAAYWEALANDSSEASAYQSVDVRLADKEAKKVSAKSKLAALGLTTEEIAAILG